MNWIKVVYFKLKEIWPLFSTAGAKKPSSFFTSLDKCMKANLSQKAMKFTEELFGISWIEFKLFISNWKRFDCGFLYSFHAIMFIWHFKIQTFFRCLNMYGSTQKFPQIFLYMSTTCCESFKSFGEVGKKFFISNFYDPKILSPAKNGMSLTAVYSEVSSAITNLFYQSYFNIWGTCSKKVWMYMMLGLGFVAILKKVLWACHKNIVVPNGLIKPVLHWKWYNFL